MKFKIWVCIALVAFISTLFTSFSCSAVTYFNDNGFLVAEGSNYNSSIDYTLSYPAINPTVDNSVSLPSDYVLFGTYVYTYSSANVRKTWIYYPASASPPTLTNVNSSGYNYKIEASSPSQFFYIQNRVSSSGSYSFVSSGYDSSFQSSYNQYTFFYPVLDGEGNTISPPNYLSATLNCVTSSHFLFFNTHVDGSYSGSVQYYIFPSSVSLSSNATLVSSGSSAELTNNDSMTTSFINRGFEWFVDKYRGIVGFGRDFSNNEQYTLYSSTSNYSPTFNPANISSVYAFIGSAPVDSPAYLDLKSVSRTGVYAQDSLCLVAVVNNSSSYSYSRFDFNIADMLNGVIKPPTSIHNTVTPQQQPVTDLQDLADYLKYLSTVNDGNDTIRDRNFIAMLGALPWSNFVGAGVGTGLTGWLPQLGMELDNIFGSLFDDWSNPSQEDIDELIDEIDSEKDELRSKLGFVDDVKEEVLFIHSSILESGATPPKFEVPLSVFWNGGSSDKVIIINFESIPFSVISAVRDFLTVFLTLAVVVYIWRTLPSTIGNMPNDKE